MGYPTRDRTEGSRLFQVIGVDFVRPFKYRVSPGGIGFRQNTDSRSTDPLKNQWENEKKPRTINGTRFKFINKFTLPETSKMAVALQISSSFLT